MVESAQNRGRDFQTKPASTAPRNVNSQSSESSVEPLFRNSGGNTPVATRRGISAIFDVSYSALLRQLDSNRAELANDGGEVIVDFDTPKKAK